MDEQERLSSRRFPAVSFAAFRRLYIAMSNECGYDFLLSRVDDFDDTYTSSNSQERILGRFVASPCTNTKFFLRLVYQQHPNDRLTLSSTYVDRISIPSVLCGFATMTCNQSPSMNSRYVSAANDGKDIVATSVFVKCNSK